MKNPAIHSSLHPLSGCTLSRITAALLAALTLTITGCKNFNPSAEQITAVGNLALSAAQIASMYRQNDGVKRVSLCVGIYSNSMYGYCDGADLDATRDAALFHQLGFDRGITLLNGDATRAKIVTAGTALCSGLKSNDLFVISLSSHGGQTPDLSGDETTGYDQYFSAADGPILDDDIARLIAYIPCRILFKVDTCHSGSMYRSPHNYAAAIKNRIRNARLEKEVFTGSMLFIAGCAENTVSYGNKQTGGQLSYTMHTLIPKASSYDHWCTLIQANMPPTQIPVITKIGSPDFGHQPLFY